MAAIKNIAVTAIIQSRMDSTRLNSKAMLPLAGEPLTFHVIQRAAAIEGISCVVLATGDDPVNKPLEEIAQRFKINFFAGSVKNVLDRYFSAAQKFGGGYIVRVTGDNPFTDPAFASLAVKTAIENNADLCAPEGLPLGTAVEVIKREALDECMRGASKPYHFEHVTPYIKENPDKFKIVRFPSNFPESVSKIRLTVDTPDDYRLAQYIFSRLASDKIIPLSEIIRLLAENPEAMKINSSIEQRPMTHSSN